MNKKIKVTPIKLKSYTGYDLQVLDEEATVQDYLDSLDELFLGHDLSRARNQVATCEGCPKCCNERIPLTSIDLNLMLEHFNLGKSGQNKLALVDFIIRFAYVTVEGPAVDITLRRPLENCIHLNDLGKCSKYLYRPLVCRTFFCCPSTKRAELLREFIVNTGEDELIRLWLTQIINDNNNLTIDEAYDAEPDLDDWPENPFSGKEQYNEIKLKDLCPANLWSQLTN